MPDETNSRQDISPGLLAALQTDLALPVTANYFHVAVDAQFATLSFIYEEPHPPGMPTPRVREVARVVLKRSDFDDFIRATVGTYNDLLEKEQETAQ